MTQFQPNGNLHGTKVAAKGKASQASFLKVVIFQVNLSSLEVNVDCDNTTLIQPPRVSPYNGTSVNNTSSLLISDDVASLNPPKGNNSWPENMNMNEDKLCITEFLSSFPDVSFSSLSEIQRFQSFFSSLPVSDVFADFGPNSLWSLPNDDQRAEDGRANDLWHFLFDYRQYCQRLPFRV